MNKLVTIDEFSDYGCLTSCALNSLMTSIMDDTVNDLKDYHEKPDKTDE